MCRIKANYCASLLIVLVMGTLNAQDVYIDKMAAAKTQYFQAEATHDQKIIDWFDDQEERARSKGDREAVVFIKNQRDAYTKNGVIPSDVPRLLSRQLDSAKIRLRRDYGSIVSSLTRDGFDKRAAEAEMELETILSGVSPYDTLFNGRDLAGWQGDPTLWKAMNGTIIGETPPGGVPTPTYLHTKEQYGDFELQCEIKLTGTSADSGLMFRSMLVEPTRFELAGPQCNLGPNIWGDFMIQGAKTGPIRTKPLRNPDRALVNKLIVPNEFNSIQVRCVGKQIAIKFNGTEIVNGAFPDVPDKGVIGFQLWPKTQTSVQVRNVRLTKL